MSRLALIAFFGPLTIRWLHFSSLCTLVSTASPTCHRSRLQDLHSPDAHTREVPGALEDRGLIHIERCCSGIIVRLTSSDLAIHSETVLTRLEYALASPRGEL